MYTTIMFGEKKEDIRIKQIETLNEEIKDVIMDEYKEDIWIKQIETLDQEIRDVIMAEYRNNWRYITYYKETFRKDNKQIILYMTNKYKKNYLDHAKKILLDLYFLFKE